MAKFDFEACLDAIWKVSQRHTRLTSGSSTTFYHFTGKGGFEGILRSGCLWASHRSHMNDRGEFSYGLQLISEVIDREYARSCSTVEYQRFLTILKLFIIDFDDIAKESTNAFCSCLTEHSDNELHWREYCGADQGFAIGVDLQRLLQSQERYVRSGDPYLVCLPVSYEREFQKTVAESYLRVSFPHWLNEMDTHPGKFAHPVRVISEVEKAVVAPHLQFLNSIKTDTYANERELRVFQSSNNGTLYPAGVCRDTGSKRRYILINFCDPETSRIPLDEVVVGPGIRNSVAMEFANNLLRELGYFGKNPRPRLRFSSLS